MPIHKIKLIARQEVAKNTFVFIFEKPPGFIFSPGQYAGFTLIDPKETDAGGNTRRFSLLSSPNDDYLSIATRFQPSAYKRILNSLPIGSEVKLAGPSGNFTLQEDQQIPAVFIAGGIGITPFYSIIKTATQQQSSQSLYLFYGNQSPEDAAFLAELIQLQKENSHFKLITTMANPNDTWVGETGFITHTMIKKYVPDLSTPLYYICGSPAMVTTLQETLIEMDIPADKIKVEDFPGY